MIEQVNFEHQIISFEIGEIDFIVAHALTSSPTTQADVEGDAVLLETIPEILTKKIYHRGASIAPRDIFDIAAGSETQADSLIEQAGAFIGHSNVTPCADR